MSGFNPTAQPVESWDNLSFVVPQLGDARRPLGYTVALRLRRGNIH
jgi:hypothetical protein